MQEYINHVVQHIWKENNRLFEMAEMALKDNVDQVNASLDNIEKSTLQEIGKNRTDYEKLAEELEQRFPESSP
jgi:hemerythrin-like domain-containing protein